MSLAVSGKTARRNKRKRSISDKALSLTPQDYQWERSRSDNMVVLVERSPNDGQWKKYYLNDEWCSCPAKRRCWHLEFIQFFGGTAGVLQTLNAPK